MNEDSTRMGRQQEANQSVDDTKADGNTYFVGIGIDNYQNWPKLNNAVRDVKALTEVLNTDYGFREDHIRLLLNEEATEATIIGVFEDLANQVNSQDSLLIYYAGHGHLNNRGRGFWVPVDAPEGEVFRYIRNSTIKDYIGDIKSLHTLLISDACFSGSLFSSGQDRSSDLVADELARLPSRWAICSGRHDEVVADGPQNGHSPFAESILDVLRNNARPAITTAFLVNQVVEQTRSNYEQLPDGGPLQNVGHKRGQFVFRRQKGEGANVLWQQIESADDGSLREIVAKKALIRQYAKDYPSGDQLNAALQLGSQLEQKHQMLEVWDSEFGLMAFVQKDTSYRQQAQQRLKLLQDRSQQYMSAAQQAEKGSQPTPDTQTSKAETNFATTATPISEKRIEPNTKRHSSTLSQGRKVIAVAVFLGTFTLISFLGPLIIILFVLLVAFSYQLGQKAPSFEVIQSVALLAGLATSIGPSIIYLIEAPRGGDFFIFQLVLIGTTGLLVLLSASIARYRKQ